MTAPAEYVPRHALTSPMDDYEASTRADALIVAQVVADGGPRGKTYRPQHLRRVTKAA